MLQIKNISFSYTRESEILKDVNFSVAPGEIVGIFGSSGYGKSTLAKIISGVLKPSSGEVLVDNKPLSSGGYCPIQLIYQHPEKAVNPKWKMKKVISEGWEVSHDIQEKMEIRERWMSRWPQELSGGELQRFCISRALSPDVKYIVADEITTMLDALTQVRIWTNLLNIAKERNVGIIIVTHNMHLAKKLCDRIIDLEAINHTC